MLTRVNSAGFGLLADSRHDSDWTAAESDSMSFVNFRRRAIAMLLCFVVSGTTQADEPGDEVRAAVRKAEASVVRLRVIGGEQDIDGERVTSQVTTGVVISESGEILTSKFAVQGNPEAVLAEDAFGNRANARIIATDHIRRLVLLQAGEDHWIPAVPAPRSSLQVGQWSIALGRFFSAQSPNVSVGIISALNRIHGLAIQSDARISPVNYGGSLINLHGQAMGILVPLSPQGRGHASSGVEWYDSGIGFAIPLEDALAIADRLRAGKDLKPGRLGIRLSAAGSFSSDIRVERVAPKSPADVAGLRKGDQPIAVNDRPIERVGILEEVIAQTYAGETITLDVRRGQQHLKLSIPLAEELPQVKNGYLGFLFVQTPKPLNAPAGGEGFGGIPVQRSPKAPEPAENLAQPKGESVGEESSDSLSLMVVADSPAAAAGLPRHIDLTKLNEVPIKTLSDLATAIPDVLTDTAVQVEYRVPGEEQTRTARFDATDRPESVPRLSEDFLSDLNTFAKAQSAARAAQLPETHQQAEAEVGSDIRRQEISDDKRGRCIVFSSSHPADMLPGIVILLSAHNATEEQILADWKSLLHSHRLLVAVPVNPEKTALTQDDIPLVITSIQALASRFRADLRRVVVVADREHSRLAWQLSFGGPSPVRGIVLNNGWFSNRELEEANGAGHSVLLLESPQSTEAKALMARCEDSLRKTGFQLSKPSDRNAARTIADWSVLMRSY